MMKKTHLLGGIGFGAMALKANQVFDIYKVEGLGILLVLPLITYAMGLILGSLFPDLDTQSSFLGRRLKILSIPISGAFGHRTFTHSILFAGLIGLAIIIPSMKVQEALFATAGVTFGIGMVVGIMSHILLDMITKEGVALLYPVKHKITLTNFKTNGPIEGMVSISLVIITIASCYSIFTS